MTKLKVLVLCFSYFTDNSSTMNIFHVDIASFWHIPNLQELGPIFHAVVVLASSKILAYMKILLSWLEVALSFVTCPKSSFMSIFMQVFWSSTQHRWVSSEMVVTFIYPSPFVDLITIFFMIQETSLIITPFFFL
jgi:hypothetical protein